MDEISYPANLIECKFLGVLEAEKTERNGESFRNDIIFAAAIVSKRYEGIRSIKNIDDRLLDELTKFFITYNTINVNTRDIGVLLI